jgi:hypothetical protein
LPDVDTIRVTDDNTIREITFNYPCPIKFKGVSLLVGSITLDPKNGKIVAAEPWDEKTREDRYRLD